LETMRFLPCFKAKLVAQMRGYIDCGQFFANLSRPDLPQADIAPPRQLLRSRLLGGGHRLVLTALDVLHPVAAGFSTPRSAVGNAVPNPTYRMICLPLHRAL
jgi:hypothetical protein